MKKVFLFAVVAVMFVFVGCSKTRTCNCVTTQSYVDDYDTDEMVTTTTLTIDKGHCEDMNAEQTTSMEDVTYIQTVKCTEQ